MVAALEAAGWRVSGDNGAAKLLGIKPSTLTDRMRSLGIERPR
jgi:transcriptional regulator with GAF, ATPase, and Fis domain